MSDLRVDVDAILRQYGLLSEPSWSVTPVAEAKTKRLVLASDAGPAERVIRGVIGLFEARTAVEHREAVEILSHDLIWDGPPIRLSSKGHVRLAAYLFKYLASLRIRPVAALLSEPQPGLHLIELDAVATTSSHRPLWLPLTRLLPEHVSKNIHLKIGVRGGLESGTVELLVGRLTNLPPFLPFAWQRTAVGIAMGAVPHSLENVLGFAFDAADGGDFYARKRHAAFRARHPDSTNNPTWDWLLDVATDTPGWLLNQASLAVESAQAVSGRSFEQLSKAIITLLAFYSWVFNNVWGVISQLLDAASGSLSNAADKTGSAFNSTFGAPGTAGLGTTGPQGATTATKLGKTTPAQRVVAARPAATAGGGAI